METRKHLSFSYFHILNCLLRQLLCSMEGINIVICHIEGFLYSRIKLQIR
jgi:hypothetical protein